MSTERNKSYDQMLRGSIMSPLITFYSNLLWESMWPWTCGSYSFHNSDFNGNSRTRKGGRIWPHGFTGVLLLTVRDNSYNAWRDRCGLHALNTKGILCTYVCCRREPRLPCNCQDELRHKRESTDPEVPVPARCRFWCLGKMRSWIDYRDFLCNLPGLARKEKCTSIISNCTF